ncbi:MAG: flagellar protein FlaG [Bacillota bacterium]
MRIESPEAVKMPKLELPSRVAEENTKPPTAVGLLRQIKSEEEKTEGDKAVDVGQLQDFVNRLNLMLELTWYDLRFQIHDATHEIMVQVVNRDTGEVVREIPPKKILDMWAEMKRLIGMLMDKRV